jgi:hypothetical protein
MNMQARFDLETAEDMARAADQEDCILPGPNRDRHPLRVRSFVLTGVKMALPRGIEPLFQP